MLKNSAHQNGTIFGGYASVFDIIDTDMDIVMSGAFKDSMVDEKVPILWQHNMHQEIGFVTIISEDDYGLYIEGVIFRDTILGAKIVDMILNGMISGLSIGYKIAESDILYGVHYIRKINLVEVSVVRDPANEYARIVAIDKEENDMPASDALRSLRLQVSRLKLLDGIN